MSMLERRPGDVAGTDDTSARPGVLAELAPTGTLRVAIAVGPAPSAVFAVRDPGTGTLRGVTVVLAEALAQATGLPIALLPYRASGEIQAAAVSGAWDVTFIPVEERHRGIDFGAVYHILKCTYLVPAGSRIKRAADADAPGFRIAGVRDSATLRASMRASPRATHLALDCAEDAVALMRGGNADVIVLGRELLAGIALQIEGSRVLDDILMKASIAVAVPQDRPRALALVSAVIEEAKASGLMRREFAAIGISDDPAVAPPGTAP